LTTESGSCEKKHLTFAKGSNSCESQLLHFIQMILGCEIYKKTNPAEGWFKLYVIID
jgi:hypothetical protein